MPYSPWDAICIIFLSQESQEEDWQDIFRALQFQVLVPFIKQISKMDIIDTFDHGLFGQLLTFKGPALPLWMEVGKKFMVYYKSLSFCLQYCIFTLGNLFIL